MTDGYHAPGMEAVGVVGEGLRADLDDAATRFDAATDARIADRVAGDIERGVLGLGAEDAMSLFDITRYAVLRARHAPASPDDDDRRAWLLRSVEALVPPAGTSVAARVVYGTSPAGLANPSAQAATSASRTS